VVDWNAVAGWWKQPFNTDASAGSWFLFTGFILIVIFLWSRILREGGHVIGEVT
jgi:hypothetical protein